MFDFLSFQESEDEKPAPKKATTKAAKKDSSSDESDSDESESEDEEETPKKKVCEMFHYDSKISKLSFYCINFL